MRIGEEKTMKKNTQCIFATVKKLKREEGRKEQEQCVLPCP